jgi:hypothetical protein
MVSLRQSDVLVKLQKVATALEGFGNKTLPLDGKAWKGADLLQAVQQQISALQASTDAHTAWLKAVADQRSGYKTLTVLLEALRSYIAALYGTGSDMYLSFGFVAPKKGKANPEVKAAAIQQTRATREARHIMGKNQRLAIKAVVPPVTAAPAATSPSAPSTASTTTASASSPNGANGQSH